MVFLTKCIGVFLIALLFGFSAHAVDARPIEPSDIIIPTIATHERDLFGTVYSFSYNIPLPKELSEPCAYSIFFSCNKYGVNRIYAHIPQTIYL